MIPAEMISFLKNKFLVSGLGNELKSIDVDDEVKFGEKLAVFSIKIKLTVVLGIVNQQFHLF